MIFFADVSMTAIQYLNSYYVGRQLDHESEFVSQCMAHLAAATVDLVDAEESSLLCIQRALLLLKTHKLAMRASSEFFSVENFIHCGKDIPPEMLIEDLPRIRK